MKDSNDNEDIQEDLEPTEEIVTENVELEDIEENSKQKLKELREKLKACEQEKMENLENLQRAKAEFLNGKRRLEEEKVRDKERAIEKQIEKLLPLCDSFHIAMNNKQEWEAVDETWRKGIESIYNQLQSILVSYNVSEFNPQGETFDPSRHEAMANVPVSDQAMHHKIISVIQNGFVRNVNGKEELMRPARVTVGEFTSK